MNSIFIRLVCVMSGCLVWQSAVADSLVRFPKGPAAWTIDITASPNTSSKPAVPIVKMEIFQDDQKRRTLATASNGTIIERWLVPGPGPSIILAEESNGNVIFRFNVGDDAISYGLGFDESSFQWLKPSLLVEKNPISYQGTQCYHYKGTVSAPALQDQLKMPGVTPATLKVEAWIDSETLAPVALDDGVTLATYTYLKPPFPPLTLPPKFQQLFERIMKHT